MTEGRAARQDRHATTKEAAARGQSPEALGSFKQRDQARPGRHRHYPESDARLSANEEVTFTRLEGGPHHDGVRFANGAEVALQKLGPGVKGYICEALLSPLWKSESAEVA